MNDRQRVELMLFVDLLQHVVETGASKPEERHAKQAVAFLQECRKETIAGLTPDALTKLLRRVARLDRDALSAFRVPGQPVAGFGLVGFVLLRDLTETGYLAFSEGGALDKALRLLLPPLSEFAETPGALEAAERKAAIAFETMKAGGYLVGYQKGGSL